MTGREPAWRVLAHEFLASLHQESGTGERPVRHLISPLGARMNRVLVVGTLGVPEPVGKDPNAPFLRARLSDPTGTVPVTAGGFQPRALAAFQEATSARLVLLVGKSHLFTGRDGVAYGSVRTEAVRPIDETEYRSALAEAVRQTLQRIELVEDLRAGRGPEDAASAARGGIPPLWWTGAVHAVRLYPSIDLAPFRAPLANVLRAVEGGPELAPVPAPPEVRVTRAPPPEPARAPSAAERAEEAAFLDIVDDLAERSADGYADLKEALGLAEQRGVDTVRAEELLNGLEESGVLEEPVVGKLRRA